MEIKREYYLLLDEVQLLDCFESVLNGYLRKDNMDVYVTGSNAKFLSKDIITEFAEIYITDIVKRNFFDRVCTEILYSVSVFYSR